jgi:hypothetical protein
LANKLLAKGARVDVRDAAGLSALDYGVATGDSELVDLLKNSPRAAPQKPTEQVEPTPTQVSDITPTHAVDVPDIGAKEQPALAPNPKATEEAADPLKISRELISAGNFEKAREILSELSKQGNSDAMYELGRLTIRGDGGKQNLEAARMLWEQAAERNHGASLIALAKLYYYGDGVPKSRSVSKLYIDRAKAQGASIPGELEK